MGYWCGDTWEGIEVVVIGKHEDALMREKFCNSSCELT
jgi:hypothetical protein